jgi:26S proteasome regulatory subunit N6
MATTASNKILTPKLKEAAEFQKAGDSEQAIKTYNEILSVDSTNDNVLREQETALVNLGELFKDLK